MTYVDHRSLLHRVHPLVKLVILFSFSLTALRCILLQWDNSFLPPAIFVAGRVGLAFSRKLRFILVFGFFSRPGYSGKSRCLLWQLSLGTVCFRFGLKDSGVEYDAAFY